MININEFKIKEIKLFWRFRLILETRCHPGNNHTGIIIGSKIVMIYLFGLCANLVWDKRKNE